MHKLPLDRRKDWPEEILQALAWHEAGHTLTAIHYGQIIAYVWIGDGRAQAPAHHTATDSPGIEGVTLSMSKVEAGDVEALAESFFSQVYSGCAPEASEVLCPEHKRFKTLHEKHPKFFYGDSGFTVGSVNDMNQAFNLIAPAYMLFGMSEQQGMKAFQKNFRLPTQKLMIMYRPQIEALVASLIEKRYIDGRTVHEIVCAAGHGSVECHDHLHLPGCTCEGTLDEGLIEKLKQTQEGMSEKDVTARLLETLGKLGLSGMPNLGR